MNQKKPLHARIDTLLVAIKDAVESKSNACFAILSEEAGRVIQEVKELEESKAETDSEP